MSYTLKGKWVVETEEEFESLDEAVARVRELQDQDPHGSYWVEGKGTITTASNRILEATK